LRLLSQAIPGPPRARETAEKGGES
jgi:hypothetical protein